MELEQNSVIGNYRIVGKIGDGGMGTVYEVEHVALGVRYAMKVFRARNDGDSFSGRFASEGRLLARLSHPNLVRVFDLGYDAGGGFAYYVMDLVSGDGASLRTLADVQPGDVDEDVIADWFRQMCSAVDYIHANGVVHRDIKPGNILMSRGGRPVLSDFGVSCIFAEALRADVGAPKTRENRITDGPFVMGTEGFMSPELRRGGEASPAADVFALGVVFFRLLTGVWYDTCLEPNSAITGKTGVTSKRLLEYLDYNWAAILPQMLASDPAQRPETLASLADTLGKPGRGETGEITEGAVGVSHGSRRRVLAWFAAAAVAVVASAVAVMMMTRAPRRAEVASASVTEDFHPPSLDEVYAIPKGMK